MAPSNGAIEQQRFGEAVVAQGGDEGGGVPVAVGHGAAAARRFWGAPVQPGHLGVQASFIQEDEPGDGPAWLPAVPLLAGHRNVRPILLCGAQRFFYSSGRGVRDGARARSGRD